MVIPSIRIRNREIGPGHPTYIIAELSANHRQDLEEAVKLVRAAKACGADAVKAQTYTPDTLTIPSRDPLFVHHGGPWDGKSLYDLYTEAYMPWEWQPRLSELAEQEGIDFLSTAYDISAVEFLEGIGVAAHKVASFELTDIPLIERIARTGKPLIISTGMAYIGEIEEAVIAARNAGATQIALLKCTSAYPAPPEELNLRTIPHMSEAFGVPVGLSDHTLGIAVPVAAVSLGACIVEKHLTLSRSAGGPDATFSLEPDEFREMVDAVRVAERALGTVRYGPSAREQRSRAFRRSLFVVTDVKKGDVFTHESIRSIRPSAGLHPRFIGEVIGRRAARDIEAGTPLRWDLIG